MPTMTLSDLLAGRPLFTVTPEASLREAAQVLGDRNVGALPVVTAGGALVGILSERDIIRKAICTDRALGQTRVDEIMTPDPVTVPLDATLAQAMARMARGGFRHLPVTEDGRLAGIVSFRDIPAVTRVLAERYEEFRASTPGYRMRA